MDPGKVRAVNREDAQKTKFTKCRVNVGQNLAQYGKITYWWLADDLMYLASCKLLY